MEETILENRYKFIKTIGSGGMGTVYEALDIRIGKSVAIKVVREDKDTDETARQRFTLEAQNLAALDHPHITRLLDFFQADGKTYLVMNFVGGETLHEKLLKRPFTPEETVAIGHQILDALEHAHSKGIVHRDLKPQNIKFTESGRVVLLDFGIAKVLGTTTTLTRDKQSGTPFYMSPESIDPKVFGKVDTRSDIYCFGVLLFQMLTKQLPYDYGEDPSVFSVGYAHCHQVPKRLRDVDANLPQKLDEVIQRALAKQPSNRFSSAAEMRDALNSSLVQPQRAETSTIAIKEMPQWAKVGGLWTILGGLGAGGYFLFTGSVSGFLTCVGGVAGTLAILRFTTERTVIKTIASSLSKPRQISAAPNSATPVASSSQLEPRQISASPNSARIAVALTSKATKIEYITIPAGKFLMGDDKLEVHLDTYQISKYPVTVAQFRKFTEVTQTDYDWNRRKPSWGWIDDHPMVSVTWDEACAFCQWAGGDLPTEAQWEKAARGTDGREYPWGNDWDPKKCRCSVKTVGDSGGTIAVGSYPNGVSPYGVHDMSGNVWEWCRDYYDPNYNKNPPNNNPENQKKSSFRVLRGNSWNNVNPQNFRCANRNGSTPANRYAKPGFRVVL